MEKITINNLPVFIHIKYLKYGIEKDCHIQTRELCTSKQDACIGDFGENWYIRPRKATLRKEYKTLTDYKRACTLALKKHLKDIHVLYYYILVKVPIDRSNYTGEDYEVKI